MQVLIGAWFSPDITLRIKAKQFNLDFLRPENLAFSHAFLQTPNRLSSDETLLSAINGRLEDSSDGCSSGTLPRLQLESMDLSV